MTSLCCRERSAVISNFVTIDGARIHYVEAGAGEPVLLLHGWPTSSYLWRDVIPVISEAHRVIAPDLLGFGRSDKPMDCVYDFDCHERILEGLLNELDIKAVNLVVHDLGGPVGLMWAVRHPERVLRLGLLNTLVYPQLSWAARLFALGVRLPGVGSYLSSPRGIATAMRIGVFDKSRMRTAQIKQYRAPFTDRLARKVLLKTVRDLEPKDLIEVEQKLPSFVGPVRIIYGAKDKILPDVAATMRRVADDLPQARITEIPEAGHFLQEEHPYQIGKLLADFFSESKSNLPTRCDR